MRLLILFVALHGRVADASRLTDEAVAGLVHMPTVLIGVQ